MSELIVTVTADPPWPWDDRLRMQPTKRGSEDQYGKMTIDEIKDLYKSSQVQHVESGGNGRRAKYIHRPGLLAGYPLADVGFCNLWTTATHILNGNAMDVMRHWGYEPKQIVPWVKGRVTTTDVPDQNCEYAGNPKGVLQLDTLGMGWATRVCAEYLIIGTRGKYKDLVKRHDVAGLILAMRPPKRNKTTHSRKPPDTYTLIESLFPGPYLELFPGDDSPEHWAKWGRPRPEIVHPDTPIEWP